MFAKILNPDKLDRLIQNSTMESLALITTLTKLCNSPILLKAQVDKVLKQSEDNAARTTAISEAVKLLPDRAQVEDVSLSGRSKRAQILLSFPIVLPR